MARVIEVVKRGPKGDSGDPGIISTSLLSGAHSAVLTERSYFFRCNAVLTFTLGLASVLGNGWHCWVRAENGSVTIATSGTDTIEGAATLVIIQDHTALVFCDGTNFYAVNNLSVGDVSMLQPLIDFPLTNAEVQQLQNINTRTVSNAQWGYLGAMDQGVTTISSITIAGLTVNGSIALTGLVDGRDVAADGATLDTAILDADFAANGLLKRTAAGTYTSVTAPAGAVIGTTDAQTLTNKTLDASLNTLSALTTSMFAANVVDTDGTLTANSDTRLPSQKAARTYMDNAITGIKWKPSVLVATTANIILSGEQALDGVLTSASRVLVKDQTAGAENGIYLTAAGAWTRTTGGDTAAELTSATVTVEQGATLANTAWTMTTDNVTLGTTALVWTRMFGAGQYSAGTGMLLSGNQFSVNSPLQSISALGSAADKLLYTTALNTFAETPFTLFARTLMDDADAATMRATLGVDAAGTDNSTDVTLAGTGTYLSLAGQAITVDPITESDIADLGTLTTMNTDIGVTVQAHSAVLDATTASFLTAHKAKLDFTTVTQAVDLDTMESRIAALSAAVVLKGTWDASLGSFPTSTVAGESWIVSVAGTVGGIAFVANDRIIATVNTASTTIYAANWHKLDYTDAVLSVAGRTGAVTLTVADLVGFTDNSANWDTAFTWGNHALAGYAANTNVANWDTAYTWGDHATAGYLTGLALSGLSDATITTIAAGELLKWDGTAWINNTLVEAGVQASNARLSDIAGITYAGGDLLYHNGTNLVKLPKGTAAQVLTMDGAGAVPTWAAAIAGGGGGYTTDISFLYLGMAANAGTRMNMVGGIADPFADASDVATSTNLTLSYNAFSLIVSSTIVSPTNMTSNVLPTPYVASSNPSLSTSYQLWDGDATTYANFAIGVLPGSHQIDLGSAQSVGGYSLFSNLSAAYLPSAWTFEGSNDAINWTLLDDVAAGGLTVGVTSTFTSLSRTFRYFRINISAGGTSGALIHTLKLLAPATVFPTTLISNSFTASAVPTTCRLGVQASGALTINTDLIGYVSRDGGTTWATATLVLIDTLADGTKYYEDAAVSVATQPSGTAMQYKIVTANANWTSTDGVLLQWS